MCGWVDEPHIRHEDAEWGSMLPWDVPYGVDASSDINDGDRSVPRYPSLDWPDDRGSLCSRSSLPDLIVDMSPVLDDVGGCSHERIVVGAMECCSEGLGLPDLFEVCVTVWEVDSIAGNLLPSSVGCHSLGYVG